MPVEWMAFSAFEPSRGDAWPGSGHVSMAANVLPTVYGFATTDLVKEVSGLQSIVAPWRGVYAHSRHGRVYTGDSQDLFEVDLSSDPWPWSKISKSAGAYTAGTEGWFFSAFGDSVVASCGHSSPVQFRTGTGGNFADLITSADKPRGKFIAQLGSRVALANIQYSGSGSAPHAYMTGGIWYSADQLASTFGSPSSHPGQRTDFYPLFDDFGDATALASVGDYGILAKSRALYRCSYAGPVTTHVLISTSVGTDFSNSLVPVDGVVYFMSRSGIFVANQNAVRPIGDAVSRAIFNDWIALDPSMGIDLSGDQFVWGAYDALTRCVFWGYGTSGTGTGAAVQLILAYHVPTDRMSVLEATAWRTSGDAGESTEGRMLFSIPDRSTENASPRDLAFGVLDPGLGLASLRVFKSSSTTSLDHGPTFETGYTYLGGGDNWIVKRVRLKYSLRATSTRPDMTITVKSRHSLDDTPTSNSYTLDGNADNYSGWVPLADELGRYKSIRIAMSSNPFSRHPAQTVADIRGIEVDWETAGDGS